MKTSTQRPKTLFVGIDPSLTSTAVVIVDQKGKLVSSARIETTAKDTTDHRQATIANFASVEISRSARQEEADRVVIFIEGYSMGSRGKGFLSLIELGGIIRHRLLHELTDYEVQMWEMPPSTLKLATAGKGNADKSQMMAAVEKRWGFKTQSNDTADAYALAMMATVAASFTSMRTAPWRNKVTRRSL